MNKVRIAAAAWAVTLTAAMSMSVAAEVPQPPQPAELTLADLDRAALAASIQGLIEELQANEVHDASMVARIDAFVAEIDARLEAGAENKQELLVARNQLLYARGTIIRQLNGEQLVNHPGEGPLAPGGGPGFHGGPLGGGFGGAPGGTISGGGGGAIGGGGIGGGSFGGLGLLGGVAAAIAFGFDDDDAVIGVIASPSN